MPPSTFDAGSARSASAPPSLTPALAAKAWPRASAESGVPSPCSAGHCARPPPEETMALWNSPRACGASIRILIDSPPADSP